MKTLTWCAVLVVVGAMMISVSDAVGQDARRTIPDDGIEPLRAIPNQLETGKATQHLEQTVSTLDGRNVSPELSHIQPVLGNGLSSLRGTGPIQSPALLQALESMGLLPERLANSVAAAHGAGRGNSELPDVATMKKTLAAGASDLSRAQIQQLKQSGMSKIQAARQTFGSRAVSPAGASKRTLSTTRPDMARKTPLLPLPSVPATPIVSRNARAIQKLLGELELAESVDQRDRLSLRLAAAYVGDGRLAEAAAIYLELEQFANTPGIRNTATVNLQLIGGGE